MATRDNTLLLAGAALALVVVGTLGNFLGARSAPPPASPRPAVVEGGTHVESEAHATNVLPAGDHHVEAQVGPTGKVRIFLYGAREGELLPIPSVDAPLLVAEALPAGADPVPVSLRPDPNPGDPPGNASRFVGAFARRPDQTSLGFSLTLPIEGRTYRVVWSPEQLSGGAKDASMPAALSDDAAARIFLSAGGTYTQADIDANGRTTPARRYGGQMTRHDAHPKPGDRLCPISETRANPRFAWTIGGKVYTFCCPPCIEEYVRRARASKTPLPDPETYVKKADGEKKGVAG